MTGTVWRVRVLDRSEEVRGRGPGRGRGRDGAG